jgi:hypothetical protein
MKGRTKIKTYQEFFSNVDHLSTLDHMGHVIMGLEWIFNAKYKQMYRTRHKYLQCYTKKNTHTKLRCVHFTKRGRSSINSSMF